jgi:hypothetical protein
MTGRSARQKFDKTHYKKYFEIPRYWGRFIGIAKKSGNTVISVSALPVLKALLHTNF